MEFYLLLFIVCNCLLLSMVFSASAAYTSLFSGLKFLLKVRYIILVYLNQVGFLIFKTLCLCRSKTLPYVWKIISQKWAVFEFGGHIFTKLSQNVCLINIQFLIYQHDRCDCKLWNVPWFYCVFFWVFSYIIDDHSCLNYWIFTKLSQIVG